MGVILFRPQDRRLGQDRKRSMLHRFEISFWPPHSYATHVATVATENASAAVNTILGHLDIYERQIELPDYATLLTLVEQAAAAFPALVPRLEPLKKAATARIHIPGPVFLYYTGCSVASSPESRAKSDVSKDNSMVTELIKLWRVKTVRVYRVNLPSVPISVFEYRGERNWQLEEHSLIAARFPLCLNSAPGGFLHEHRVDLYGPCPLLLFPRTPVPSTMADGVKRHLEGMYEAYRNQPGSQARIDCHALQQQVDAATPRFTLSGRVPIVAFGQRCHGRGVQRSTRRGRLS